MTASSVPMVIMPSMVCMKLADSAMMPKSAGWISRTSTRVLTRPSTRTPRRQAMTQPAPRAVRSSRLSTGGAIGGGSDTGVSLSYRGALATAYLDERGGGWS
jgi:hypothetical protein